MAFTFKADGGGVQFAARIQPRSGRDRISGVHDGAIKIHLTAPPVDGAANKACIKFVASAFGVSPSRVTLVSGQTGRNKILRIEGLAEREFSEKISQLIPGAQ